MADRKLQRGRIGDSPRDIPGTVPILRPSDPGGGYNGGMVYIFGKDT